MPINTIFSGMNIHLPAILMFTRGTRFWHTAIYIYTIGSNSGGVTPNASILGKEFVRHFPVEMPITSGKGWFMQLLHGKTPKNHGFSHGFSMGFPWVFPWCWFDWGELAISRALGDLLLKNSGAGAAGGDGKSTPKVSLDDDI